MLIRLLDQSAKGLLSTWRFLGVAKGLKVYSISYAIRCARADLKLRLCATFGDILAFAETGVYSLGCHDDSGAPNPGSLARGGDVAASTSRDQPSSIFERMSFAEMKAMFDRNGDQVRVKPRFREGITWRLGDAGDPDLVGALGLQDIVVANRFLCHMHPKEAEECLRNLAPGQAGRVLLRLRWLPCRAQQSRSEARVETRDGAKIHEGDPSLRRDWPLEYWGLESLDQDRIDWKMRDASVFQRAECSGVK